MNKITVGAVWRTLIKGTNGIWAKDGELVRVDERGFERDRKWVIVNEHGMFVAQRKGSTTLPIVGRVGLPSSLGAGVEILSMCQIAARIEGEEMLITAPGMKDCRLPLERAVSPIVTVQVWNNASLTGVDEGKEVSAWLSEFLSREKPGTYRLVRMTNDCRRPSKRGEAIIGFHDSHSFMMMSDKTLGELNGRLFGSGAFVVQADRFRPNIWFRDCDAHAEDFLDHIRIGDVEFRGGKLCDRCLVTCTDQKTAVRGSEPLATLATYRRGRNFAKLRGYENAEALGLAAKPNAVFLGRYFDHLNTGIIRIGDRVEVLQD